MTINIGDQVWSSSKFWRVIAKKTNPVDSSQVCTLEGGIERTFTSEYDLQEGEFVIPRTNRPKVLEQLLHEIRHRLELEALPEQARHIEIAWSHDVLDLGGDRGGNILPCYTIVNLLNGAVLSEHRKSHTCSRIYHVAGQPAELDNELMVGKEGDHYDTVKYMLGAIRISESIMPELQHTC